MSEFVNTVDIIGDEALATNIIDKTITEIVDSNTTTIGDYAFYECSGLTTADFPAVTSIGDYAFYECSGLTTADFPAVTSIGEYAFRDCSELTTAHMPNVGRLEEAMFRGCSKLTTADFPAATYIGYRTFTSCSALTRIDTKAEVINQYPFNGCVMLSTFILRYTGGVCIMYGTFDGTPIASGTGYIYVPKALVDSYKAATNWSTYANQIRAIEDYPDITGG